MPDILRLVGLSTKLHNYPDELSGGEQQRVSIARAFVNHPPLLLADEPTGNLDPETSIGIMQLIYRINRTGTTVVVATHDSEMVDKMRRRVVELREGRIIRDELSGLYRPDESDHRVRGAPARRAGRGRRGPPQLMRLGFFLKEALRGLRRSSAPALAALLTVLLTALVLGVFIPIVQATTGTANEVRSRVVVDVYIKDRRHRAQQRRAAATRSSGTTNVKSVEYISKAEALGARAGEEPEGLRGRAELLGANPLPASFRVTPEDPDKLDAIVDGAGAARRRRPRASPAIDEVRNREEDTDKILSATGLVKALTAGLAALLVFASIALIANTIRLSIFARRREVEVMKLVGRHQLVHPLAVRDRGRDRGLLRAALLAVLLLTIAKADLHRPAVGPLRPAGGARTRSTSRC